MAMASADGSVRVWDIGRNSEILVRPPGGALMTAVSFSPDGRRVVAGGTDQIVRVFDPVERGELVSLHGHVGRITALRFTPDGRTLLSSSIDGTVRCWEAREWRTGAGE